MFQKVKNHLLLCLVILNVSGGANLMASGSNESIKDSADAELRITWWGSELRHDLTIEVLDNYSSDYSEVRFQPEPLGWSGYWDRIATLAAGGSMPDVVQTTVYAGYLAAYVANEQLLDLSPYLGKEIEVSGLDDTALDGATFNGGIYGIPLGSSSISIQYDPQIFKSAGVEPPHDDWTWSDYEDAVITIHERLGVYGSQEIYDGDWFAFYVRQHGYDFFDSSGNIGYPDELFVEYFEQRLRLVDAGAIPTLDVMKDFEGLDNSLLVHGRAAMGWHYFNQLPALERAAGRPFELALPPKAASDSRGLAIEPTMYWSVAASAGAPTAAAEFIDYFVNGIGANRVLMAERGVPWSAEVRAALNPELTPVMSKVFSFMDRAATVSSPLSPPAPPVANRVYDAYHDVVERILYREITPLDAAVEFRERAEQILSRQQ
jgi:multiple sugar transport system substrate-binding protein